MDVATPQNELLDSLLQLGWSVKKIALKNGFYVADGYSDATGAEFPAKGKTPEMALAALLSYANRANAVRRYAAIKVAAWTDDWLDQTTEIGQAYAKMPVFDEKAVPAWKALAAESKIQADAIRKQITVEVTDDPEPYMSAQEMCEDVHRNRHFTVSRANCQHPIWSQEDSINFRIVHDVLGHCQSGGDFSWQGENLACGVHFPLVSPLAREALFTECIGQQAYYRTFHGFGPQKVGFLSDFLHPVQQKNGEHVWVPHGTIPHLQQAPNENAKGTMDQAPGATPNTTGPGQWVQPQQLMPSPVMQAQPAVMQGFEMSSKQVSPGRPADPNQFWVPEDQAAPVDPSAMPGSDYIDLVGTMRNAAKIDTEWWNEPEDRQNQAIMNAFRVAILSPRKHIKWNAAHYQAIMNAAPNTPAVDLWNMLEDAREKHNQALGYPEGSHLSYRKQLDFLTHELQLEDPSLSDVEARREAKEIVFRKTKEFERALGADPANEGTSEMRRYQMAKQMVQQWLEENYTPAQGWTPGQLSIAKKNADNLREADWSGQLFDAPPAQTQDDTGFASDDSKYGAFMGTHLDAIAQVGQHIDDIRKLALEDIQEGGRGFIFRNGVMNLNLPGVNPKVASFAWLLLAPMSSELGIVDTHIARGLRRSIDSVTPKDFYKMERMQRAFKDATGYSHVPLGIYHWGMWDMIRNPGQHSDHSALRVLDPIPWDQAQWDAGTSARQGLDYVGPVPFEAGRGAAEKAAIGYDAEFPDAKSGEVPLVQVPGSGTPVPSGGLHIVPATAMTRPYRG